MPEISLTPQMQKRLESFFGEAVAVWHSKITPKKKEQILKDIKSGKARLVAGARSALFLPLERLKLIIIDEEHDDSYKNTGSKPHYNARDLALFLTSKFDLQVVLGSATPSLTSFYKQECFRLKGHILQTRYLKICPCWQADNGLFFCFQASLRSALLKFHLCQSRSRQIYSSFATQNMSL